jgi:restriction system protein
MWSAIIEPSKSSADFRLMTMIALAVVSYFVFHYFASMDVAKQIRLKTILSIASLRTIKTAASYLQYILPVAFFLFAGAIASKTARNNQQARKEPHLPAQEEPQPLARPKVVWGLELLREIDWKRFEEICADYFRAIGFRAVTQNNGPDGGIDITLYAANNAGAVSAIVQCKRWSSQQVGPKAIREFLGVMTDQKISKGFFVTSSSFNSEAIRLALDNNIELIDGATLLTKILKLPPEQQVTLLNAATEGDYLTPTCANCGIKLVERNSSMDGSKFWGCVNYPRCRFTQFSNSRA